jgi:phosphatidylinositol 4-kinase
MFQQLTIKAFLAVRPHAEQIISTVELMLGTELPSFKGEPTIRRLRERFALGLNERQAAEFIVGIVKNAHQNMRSVAYDEFQRVRFKLKHPNDRLTRLLFSFKMAYRTNNNPAE